MPRFGKLKIVCLMWSWSGWALMMKSSTLKDMIWPPFLSQTIPRTSLCLDLVDQHRQLFHLSLCLQDLTMQLIKMVDISSHTLPIVKLYSIYQWVATAIVQDAALKMSQNVFNAFKQLQFFNKFTSINVIQCTKHLFSHSTHMMIITTCCFMSKIVITPAKTALDPMKINAHHVARTMLVPLYWTEFLT